VERSFENIMERRKESLDRIKEFGAHMGVETEKMQDSLEPLDGGVCQPLSNLRDDIKGTALQEYIPTGETPQRTRYQYPTDLPRTMAHEVLLADIRNPPSPSKATSTVFSDTRLSPDIGSPSALSVMSIKTEAWNPLSMSLREVNPNLTTGSVMFDPTASIMSLPAVSENTVPGAKRSTRSRLAKKKAISTVTEGLENLPPIFAQGASRRKSPRLN
jgi:kinesin family member 11